jgi:arylsulfatase A-like enzyme
LSVERLTLFPLLPFSWGHNDVGFNNPSGIKTPNIDNLANTGVILTDYYVFRFCSPTRSTFLTGRYPYHIGQHTEMNLNPTPGIACGINLNYTFMPALLKNAGYVSYALGKVFATHLHRWYYRVLTS